MELLAIIVLGISTFVGFSTKERKQKPLTDNQNQNQDDPDWAFTQSYDFDSNRGE